MYLILRENLSYLAVLLCHFCDKKICEKKMCATYNYSDVTYLPVQFFIPERMREKMTHKLSIFSHL